MAQSDVILEFPTKYVEWKIHNFFDLPTTKDFKLESSPFLFKNLKFHIEIFPCNERKNGFAGTIGLFLCWYVSTVGYRLALNMGIKVSDAIVYQISDTVRTLKSMSERWGKRDFCDRVSCFFSTFDKPVTVFCSIRSLDELYTSLPRDSSQTPLEGVSSLIENFKDMYTSKLYTDVTITVKNREFLAHRSVIAARSAVFASMFGHDTVERSTGKVEISDCDPDCFDEFLLFLYTGKLDVVSTKNAISLYQTSEKYDVRELKDKCLECMGRELTLDNFTDVVQLATMYNECALLESATKYFIDKAEAILLTPKWQHFLVENPALSNEFFLKYVKRKKRIQDHMVKMFF